MSLKNSNLNINQFNKSAAEAPNFFHGQFQSDTIVRDPLVSGYAFISWLAVPEWVKTEYASFEALTEKNLRAFSGISDIDMNTFAIQEGFSGSENMFAGGAQMFQGFSMTHREYSGSPIRNAYAHWVSGIRDPVTNVATYPKNYGKEYSAANHTGELIYIMTRPDADNREKAGSVIEFACLYTMVMPTKIPMGHLNFTAGSNDGNEIEMSFVGVPHIGPDVNRIAVDRLKATLYDFRHSADYKRD